MWDVDGALQGRLEQLAGASSSVSVEANAAERRVNALQRRRLSTDGRGARARV